MRRRAVGQRVGDGPVRRPGVRARDDLERRHPPVLPPPSDPIRVEVGQPLRVAPALRGPDSSTDVPVDARNHVEYGDGRKHQSEEPQHRRVQDRPGHGGLHEVQSPETRQPQQFDQMDAVRDARVVSQSQERRVHEAPGAEPPQQRQAAHDVRYQVRRALVVVPDAVRRKLLLQRVPVDERRPGRHHDVDHHRQVAHELQRLLGRVVRVAAEADAQRDQ
mmetsp:Transcript_22711/g.68094  ORF Transcript_22711/g.68094 Transcript_22711/m.68094 type:complete len:219 (-) Transcript_22711:269-925(-)